LRGAAVLQGLAKIDSLAWADAFAEGCKGISEIGGAAEGDRTMLDALIPAARALALPASAGLEGEVLLGKMISAAELGRDRTAGMLPRRGRSSYMGERALGHVDPGAAAAVVWLTALVEVVVSAKN
jgi:triose/dihydroxyacetone kinase / FAD-AMP lyase (cyclizing)